jgi:hypothetical protein
MSYQQHTRSILLIGAAMISIAMFIHPSGGNLARIAEITPIIVGAHVLAILSCAVMMVGFWSALNMLDHGFPYARLAMGFTAFSLLAAAIAGTINGLSLPIFVYNNQEVLSSEEADLLRIGTYIRSLNQAFDFEFIGMLCIGVFFWSLSLLQHKIGKGVAIFGIIWSLLGALSLGTGFFITDLHVFRLFVFSAVIWFVSFALALPKAKKENYATSSHVNT